MHREHRQQPLEIVNFSPFFNPGVPLSWSQKAYNMGSFKIMNMCRCSITYPCELQRRMERHRYRYFEKVQIGAAPRGANCRYRHCRPGSNEGENHRHTSGRDEKNVDFEVLPAPHFSVATFLDFACCSVPSFAVGKGSRQDAFRPGLPPSHRLRSSNTGDYLPLVPRLFTDGVREETNRNPFGSKKYCVGAQAPSRSCCFNAKEADVQPGNMPSDPPYTSRLMRPASAAASKNVRVAAVVAWQIYALGLTTTAKAQTFLPTAAPAGRDSGDACRGSHGVRKNALLGVGSAPRCRDKLCVDLSTGGTKLSILAYQ